MKNYGSVALLERLMFGLQRLAAVGRAEAWQRDQALGLTPTQAEILALLQRRKGAGLTLSSVAEELCISMPTASDAVTTLVRKGLVTKVASVTDRRAMALRLSARGRVMARKVGGPPPVLASAVASLGVDEQAGMLRGLVGVIRALDATSAAPLARMCVVCEHFEPHRYSGADRPHHCTYLMSPVGPLDLQLDCPAHVRGTALHRDQVWAAFMKKTPIVQARSKRRNPC